MQIVKRNEDSIVMQAISSIHKIIVSVTIYTDISYIEKGGKDPSK